MPRPLRLEFEDAFYHVMSRGRGRQAVFHSPEYYHAFLDCLTQAHERFAAEILCTYAIFIALRTKRQALAIFLDKVADFSS